MRFFTPIPSGFRMTEGKLINKNEKGELNFRNVKE
jgi:hypothetical protein